MKPKRIRIQEYVAGTGSSNVDRENAVIRNVKVLGVESANGRTYRAEAIRAASRFYDGKRVYLNHDPQAARRKYQDKLGELKDVRVQEDGLYADFHFNPKHAAAEQFLWDAEHAPHTLGFSHDAHGRSVMRDGREVVEEITSVASVDLVAEPATTNSLFESIEEKPQTMKKTVKQIAEQFAAKHEQAAHLKRLIEEDEMPAEMAMAPVEMPVEEGGDEPDADEQIKAAFRQAIVAAFDDDKLDMAATLGKIKELLKAYEKLAGGESSEETAPTAEESEAVESLKREIAGYKARENARDLLESKGIQPTRGRIAVLANCTSSAERNAMLAEFKPDAGLTTEARSGERVLESRRETPDYTPPKDYAELKARIN